MKKNLKAKNKVLYYLIFLFFSFLIIISAIYSIDFFSLKKEAEEESNLLNTIEVEEKPENIQEEIKEDIKIEANKDTKEETERMLQVKTLQGENSDIIGWIEIEGTSINYPVLQGTDNEYYMTHNYKKEKSKNGSIFLTKDYDWKVPSSNLLMYGHNLKNGTMFQELLKYENKKFYQEHPVIRFTTEKEDAEYEIISAFKSRVYYKSEKNVFRYYYFVNAPTEKEYNEFVENAKKASLYPIDTTATYPEQLITLSTCSYHVEDGRFAVVGKKSSTVK